MSDNNTPVKDTPPISGPVYDKLKFIAQIVLPGLGTLYFALAGFWNWPHATEVVGSIMAVDAFLGLLLGLSTTQYKAIEAKKMAAWSPDGYISSKSVNDVTGHPNFDLTITKDPHELLTRDTVTLKVGDVPPPVEY